VTEFEFDQERVSDKAERFTAMVHILGVQLFENNFVKVTIRPLFFDFPLICSLVCIDPFLWDKSPHRRSYLRSPPNPPHLPRSPTLRNANNIHCRLPFLTIHLARPPACPTRLSRIPAPISINPPPESCRSTHLPRAA
jgi:hypothetical protein